MGNNVWGRISAITSTQLTIVAPSSAATETTAGNAIVWFGDYVRNGVAAISLHQYAVERRFEDHNPVTRELFLGMAVGQLNIGLSPEGTATGTATFVGFNAKADTTVVNLYKGGTPTDVAAQAHDVYNTSSDVGRIGRGVDPVDASNANHVLEASININNNLRPQAAVGVLGAVGIGVGEFTVTGNLNTYFDNKDILDALLANTDTSYDIAMRNPDGRALLFDMPRIKFASGAPQVQGKNQDAVLPLGYQALRHEALGYTMHAQRFHYSQ